MSKKVLILEDDTVLSRIYRKVLEMEGYEVEAACDGAEGIDAVHRWNGTIAVILLDIMMPRMDGVQFLRQIRSEGYMTPVIVITDVRLQDIKGLDVFDIVPKPITRRDLIKAVADCLGAYGTFEHELFETVEFLKKKLNGSREVVA